MTQFNQTPTYNLSAVLKETGVTADLLRAWERRYHLPVPKRTPGGHRLYSEYDVQTVKWLRSRQAEGLSISRAVDLWQELLKAGRNPLAEFPHAAPALVAPLLETDVEMLRARWLQAALTYEESKAEEILNQAFSLYPVETVCTEVLQKALNEIGTGWYFGQISVQQEHFTTALAVRRLQTLITATPRPTRIQTVLVGCPAGEYHTFPVLLLSLLLRRRGVDVVYLGSDLPMERLEETALTIRPTLIILAAQQLITAASLRKVAVLMQGKGFVLAYGGLIFNRQPSLRKQIPAHFLGENLEESVSQIEHLLLAPSHAASGWDGGDSHQDLLKLFQDKRPRIDSAMVELLQTQNVSTDFIAEANSFLGTGLAAALELGDPALLESDLEWVKGLLSRRQLTPDGLLPFLAAYRQVVQQEMGKAGEPIAQWITTYIANKTSGLSQDQDLLRGR